MIISHLHLQQGPLPRQRHIRKVWILITAAIPNTFVERVASVRRWNSILCLSSFGSDRLDCFPKAQRDLVSQHRNTARRKIKRGFTNRPTSGRTVAFGGELLPPPCSYHRRNRCLSKCRFETPTRRRHSEQEDSSQHLRSTGQLLVVRLSQRA